MLYTYTVLHCITYLEKFIVLDCTVRHDNSVVEFLHRSAPLSCAESVAQLDERAATLVERQVAAAQGAEQVESLVVGHALTGRVGTQSVVVRQPLIGGGGAQPLVEQRPLARPVGRIVSCGRRGDGRFRQCGGRGNGGSDHISHLVRLPRAGQVVCNLIGQLREELVGKVVCNLAADWR